VEHDDGLGWSDDLVPVPVVGRTFANERRVRLGDVSPAGRFRLDSTARFLQDVSNDDTRDAGLDDDRVWVVRRTVIEVRAFAEYLESLTMTTFCGGLGSRWAERRVSMRGVSGAAVEATTLWVALDAESMRPALLTEQFLSLYGEAANGRTVRAKLLHDDPGAGVDEQPWPLRFVDFDVIGHMNNAVYWEAAEQLLAQYRDMRAPLRAEVEFRNEIRPGSAVTLASRATPRLVEGWLVTDDGVRTVNASITLRSLA
jgi:acyl-ACP thioesterase